MRTLVFATTNAGKLRELRGLLGDGWEVKSAADFPQVPEVEEDGDTFEANAEKKARAFGEATGLLSLADDSGLCVDALHGAPGVYSARYGRSDAQRVMRLLAELDGTPVAERAAHFECALCLWTPDGPRGSTHGRCDGRIALAPRGDGGFGYDPVFELPDGRTLAELTPDEKSAVSHRGQAFRRLVSLLAAG